MPRVRWGISAADVDGFDRNNQYAPYDGPIPINGVYRWKIKVLKHIAGTREKNPQLRVGMELVPRRGRAEEKRYKGYFIMSFIPVTDRTQFRYVPFLDAIGVSGRDFETRTVTDDEGNIKSIGKWRNDGEMIIKGQLADDTNAEGDPQKKIGWFGAADDDSDEDDDADEFDDDDGYDDDVDVEEYDDEGSF